MAEQTIELRGELQSAFSIRGRGIVVLVLVRAQDWGNSPTAFATDAMKVGDQVFKPIGIEARPRFTNCLTGEHSQQATIALLFGSDVPAKSWPYQTPILLIGHAS